MLEVYNFGKITSMGNCKLQVTLCLTVWGLNKERKIRIKWRCLPRTYSHSKPMTDKVMQEREIHGLQQHRIHNPHERYKLSNQAGRVWWSQSFCGQGFCSRGICGAVESSTVALRCQKPSLNVTALNLAKSNRHERREGEKKQSESNIVTVLLSH